VTEREAALTKENEELKEKLSHTQRQLDLLVRHVYGKKSEPRRLAGAEIDCDAGAARRAKQP
jgi:hypothetical protein